MKGEPRIFNMKWIVILLIAYGAGCNSFEIFGTIENPFDPEDPLFQPPQTEILAGPATGSTINQTETTFQWRHAHSNYWPSDSAGYQIAAGVAYSYRINSSAWSNPVDGFDVLADSLPYWTFDTTTGIHTFTLSGLEDREYWFEVRASYPTGFQENSWPYRRFSVDALQGPGLILSPGNANMNVNQVIALSLNAIDVVDLMGIYARIHFDPQQFVLQQYLLQADSGSFLLQNLADNVTDFTLVDMDSTNGLFSINIALTSGVGNGISGSGEVVRIILQHIGTTGISEVEILPESALRNTLNQDQLLLIQNSTISIWQP